MEKEQEWQHESSHAEDRVSTTEKEIQIQAGTPTKIGRWQPGTTKEGIVVVNPKDACISSSSEKSNRRIARRGKRIRKDRGQGKKTQ